VKVDPTFQDVILGHRWHEYLLELLIPTVYIKYAAAKPIQRQAIHYGAFWYPIWTMVWGACFFVGSFRTFHRLVGLTPNVPECEYYGVVESPQRLEEKRRLWEKYTKYRNEWMRRFDYHVYGIRPGEALSFFSPCFLPPASTPYNTRTDFKMRETNLFTNTIKHGPLPHERIPMDPNNLVTKDRPEYGFFRNYNTMWDGMEERKWANYAANTKNSN
jgi:hypothetical protein